VPAHRDLSRREFLRLAALAASAAALGACESRTPAPTAAPTRQPTPVSTPTFPDMVLVQPGAFQMGSDDGRPDQSPVHTVTLTRAFYIAKYAVTFEEYDKFRAAIQQAKPGDNGFGRGSRPVFHTPWYDAADYCNWLSDRHGLSPCYTGKGRLIRCDFAASGYRLPTEAEWEYAARGGNPSRGTLYAGSDDPNEVAWFADNSGGTTHPVGEKKPNELGIYDMSGNMWEWCWDYYDADYYARSPSTDPTGPAEAPEGSWVGDVERSRRGGMYGENAEAARVAYRSLDSASYTGGGFRVVRTA
jgi:sulfatase modifying factor 1